MPNIRLVRLLSLERPRKLGTEVLLGVLDEIADYWRLLAKDATQRLWRRNHTTEKKYSGAGAY
jgi:hypothetical protein